MFSNFRTLNNWLEVFFRENKRRKNCYIRRGILLPAEAAPFNWFWLVLSGLTGLVQLFIILPAVVLYKEKVTIPEIAGAVISVGGVALNFS